MGWADRHSPWRGARGQTPGSHRPRCRPCSLGTRSSWCPPDAATATLRRKIGSKLQSPEQQRICPWTWGTDKYKWNKRRRATPQPKSQLETPSGQAIRSRRRGKRNAGINPEASGRFAQRTAWALTGPNRKPDEEGEGEFEEGAHLIEGEIPPAAASSQRFARWRRTRAAAPAACRWGKERGDSRTAGARKASAVSSSCAAVLGTLWRVRGIIRAVRFVMDGALGSR